MGKLKSLELNGFKSFGKKSQLSFDVPVTNIVGPNGSGKSNVVEAFRFVLGEQSMKSLRGKSGKDLIFKGSKTLSKLNRAGVTITFDNKDKVFKLPSDGESINLDYEQISITREVFADGNNTYYINNTPVRLRDIIELMSSVNVGSSGHHIISQGQADRILSSSSKDRRGMIEDALGLKIFQYRLKESEKKLEKTKENAKQTESLRRELAPHIRYLRKQVEKIKKGEELRSELTSLYITYFERESTFIKSEGEFVNSEKNVLTQKLSDVTKRLESLKVIPVNNSFEIEKNKEIDDIQTKINEMRSMKDDLSRQLGKIEGLIEIEEAKANEDEKVISIKNKEFNEFIDNIHSSIDDVISKKNFEDVATNLKSIKDFLSSFRQKFKVSDGVVTTNLPTLLDTKNGFTSEIQKIEDSIRSLFSDIQTKREEISKEKENRYKEQEEKFTLENEKNKTSSSLEILNGREALFLRRKQLFEDETKEAVVLVGHQILNFNKTSPENPFEFNADEMRRSIERIKIKLEDIGTGGGGEVMKEYEEVSERDAFLEKELSDLENSTANLQKLIEELKETLDREFKTGLEKINEKFEEFFKLMFGGGSAYLSIVVQKPKKQDDNMDELEIFEEEKSFEQGIDINVSLPHKKVKELTMLSGGERSLTSIALLFAMTQVNPPPFLVLDETDAALDEANSRRYGDMIERLSEYSQLIVVTHNRETMSRGDIIYGVTIGQDGSSKLLSIKFQEAESYAK